MTLPRRLRIKPVHVATGLGVLFLILTSLSAPSTVPTVAPAADQQQTQLASSPVGSRHLTAESATAADRIDATVVAVIDGDTIDVEWGGQTQRVRLIGIDTPETVDPRKPVQCFGQEASQRAKELLIGQSVVLEADDSQGDRDKYNRFLRYVLLEDGTNFNRQMIADGYAFEYTYQVPYKYQADFQAAQRDAQATQRGLWAPTTCDGAATVVTAPTPAPTVLSADSQSAGQTCSIKGNISGSGERIYHVPRGQYYERTVIDEGAGERWFCTTTEAEAAGWRASLR